MPITAGHRCNVRQSKENFGLLRVVISITPRCDGAVGSEREAFIIAGRYCADVGKVRRHIALTTIIEAPGRHCSISFECQIVTSAGSDGHNVAQTRWNIALLVIVLTPGHNRAVAPES